MRSGEGGVSLAEILMASAIVSVVAGGTMMAYVTASRIVNKQNNPTRAEATGYARETIERFRNKIACDSSWFDPATCATGAGFPTGWTADPLPVTSTLGASAKRCYRLMQEDCDEVSGAGDCFAVQAKVCWADLKGCPCP